MSPFWWAFVRGARGRLLPQAISHRHRDGWRISHHSWISGRPRAALCPLYVDQCRNGTRGRANLYAEAGADLIMLFPNDAEELKRAPKDVAAPLVYVVSHGNRVGRPVPTFEELEEAGYKVASYAILSIIAAYEGVSQTFRRLRETGDPGIEPERAIRLRKEIEDLIGLEKLYEIEKRTTEKR